MYMLHVLFAHSDATPKLHFHEFLIFHGLCSCNRGAARVSELSNVKNKGETTKPAQEFFLLFFKKLALKQLLFLKNIFKLEPTQRSFRKSINRRQRWIIYFN